ncbi:hypothetical protein PG987_000063 [Apiospora arundinis]
MALVALFCFRYLRLLVHGWSYYFVYKPSSPVPDSPTYTAAEHITVIVPTVEPGGPTFHRCLDSICANSPARVFVVTVGAALHQTAEKMLAPVRRAHPSVTVEVHHTPVANKRRQIDSVVDKVCTPITFLVDSTAILPSEGQFFPWALAPFENPGVGLVGTCKLVERAGSQ